MFSNQFKGGDYLKKKGKIQKLIGIALLLVGIVSIVMFLGNNYEDQTDVIDRAITNLNKEDFIHQVDAAVSYNGDGIYEIDMQFQYTEVRSGEISDFMVQLGKLDIKFKKLVFNVYDRIDDKGQRHYIFEDAEMTYSDYKKRYK